MNVLLPAFGKPTSATSAISLSSRLQPALLTVLALLGEARGAAAVGEELGVAPPTAAAGGRQPAVAMGDEVGQHLTGVEVACDGALGHVHDHVLTAAAVHVLALAVHAVAGAPVGMVAVGEQRRHVAVGLQPDVAALAAVAAVRAAERDGALAAEARRSPLRRHLPVRSVGTRRRTRSWQPTTLPAAARGPPPVSRPTPPTPPRSPTFVPDGVVEVGERSRNRVTPPRYARGVMDDDVQERAERWASTMRGTAGDGLVLAHADSWAGPGSPAQLSRGEREEAEDRSWRRSPPVPDTAGSGRSRSSQIRGAPASSATAIASSTPPRSAAWPARRRCSSSPTTTSAPA